MCVHRKNGETSKSQTAMWFFYTLEAMRGKSGRGLAEPLVSSQQLANESWGRNGLSSLNRSSGGSNSTGQQTASLVLHEVLPEALRELRLLSREVQQSTHPRCSAKGAASALGHPERGLCVRRLTCTSSPNPLSSPGGRCCSLRTSCVPDSSV